MSEIFISHASADKLLVRAFVKLMRDGIGVPKSSIFCTSLEGHGVPPGKDFNKYMQTKIQAPKMVVMLMTPRYLESHFCLMETGAIWAKSLNPFPIVVPPTSYSSITKTLGLIQGWVITDEGGLLDFKTAVLKVFEQNDVEATLNEVDEHDWMAARKEWLDGLDDLLGSLEPASRIPAEEHNKVKKRVRVQKLKISELEEEIKAKDALVASLEAAKDKKEVKKVKAMHGFVSGEEEFGRLLEAVKEASPENADNSLLLHFIMDYFDKAPRFNWFDDQVILQEALEYNLIAERDGETWVNWNEEDMQKFRSAIDQLVEFFESDEGGEYASSVESDIPTDPSNKRFWKHHLSL